MASTLIQPELSAAPGREHSPDLWRAIGLSVLLFVAVLAVYSQAFRQPFFNVDDWLYVVDEPHVNGGVTRSGIAWAFCEGPTGDWCPLAVLSHMLDCQLFGLEPAKHHAVNVVLHALSAAVLLLVLWQMTGALFSSAVVAALFALHPMRVESVAWISERRDVLSGLFFMLTLGAYGHYARRPSTLRYLAVAVCLALGLLAKSILVTVPVLLLLLDYWPLGRLRGTWLDRDSTKSSLAPFPWRIVWEKLPLAGLAVGAAAVTLVRHVVPATNPVLTLPERLASATVSCVAYLGQMFVPIGLSVFYSYPEAGLPMWMVVAAAALLLAITLAAICARRSWPFFFVGWFWFLLVVLPVLELVPVGRHARADRYTYLSQIGLYIALVWVAVRLTEARPALRRILVLGAAAVLVLLAACTSRQLGFWHDSVTVWEHAVDCDPDNTTAHNELGWLFQANGDETAAVAECRKALERRPGDRNYYYSDRAQAASCLGNMATNRGDLAEAIAWLRQANEYNDNFAAVHLKLGGLLAQSGDMDRAIAEFDRCLELDPRNADCLNFRGLVLCELGRADEGLADLRKAIEVDEALSVAHFNLALFLARQGDVDGAIEHFRRVTRLEPDSPEAYFQIAELLRDQGQGFEALRYDELGEAARQRAAMKAQQP